MVRCNRRECRIDCLAATPSYYNNQNQMNELRSNQTTQPMQTASRSRCVEMKGRPAFVIRQGSAQVVVYKFAKRNQFCLCYRKHAGAARSRETRTGERAARARALEIAIALANGRAEVIELTAADRDSYLAAKALLPVGIPLHEAVEQWISHRETMRAFRPIP